ncbi:hypothetical protein LINPERHAP2_LOCUS44757 [Linum perenne]
MAAENEFRPQFESLRDWGDDHEPSWRRSKLVRPQLTRNRFI